MPSFDVVSDIDPHELTNALDQANRELDGRFDFRGSDARFTVDAKEKGLILAKAKAAYQLEQMVEILRMRLSKRGIDPRCVEEKDIEENLNEARQKIQLKHGIDADRGRKLAKAIKDSGLKVQAQINGDKLRVTGKQRDDLQQVMNLLRKQELDVPLQFENFRD
jgi:cyclic-di-GMP-binding protein